VETVKKKLTDDLDQSHEVSECVLLGGGSFFHASTKVFRTSVGSFSTNAKSSSVAFAKASGQLVWASKKRWVKHDQCEVG
jgi:hypothetical protein